MKSTEKICADIIGSITKDTEELSRFVDFVKVYALAIKIAFRCDRVVAWELLGRFLREFEKIAIYRRKYDERVDEIAARLKDRPHYAPIESRLKDILKEAEKLKSEFEEYDVQVTERCTKKGKVVL